MNNMKGFTLIESLFVVFICSIFIMLPTLSIRNWQHMLEVEHFLSSFEKKILFTQQMAVVNTMDTQVIFYEHSQQFNFLIPKNTNAMEEKLVEIPTRLKAVGPDKITFKNGSGNNGKLSKFSFLWAEKNQLIEFQFQLGSGRYVKKIKSL
ncbi:competence type IV pilus minor pilin ComGD [Candidatus Enterococcus palustris]|nr:competence type IV pilus minor pilin ComGD [Enterococcus sp. 7F3_DIV0205]